MTLLHSESFPAHKAGWILSYSPDQFSGRGSCPSGRFLTLRLARIERSQEQSLRELTELRRLLPRIRGRSTQRQAGAKV